MASIKIKYIPAWVQIGEYFKMLTTFKEDYTKDDFLEQKIQVEDKYIIESDEIEDIEDFKNIYECCKYWQLKFTDSMYNFAYINKYDVHEFFGDNIQHPDVSTFLSKIFSTFSKDTKWTDTKLISLTNADIENPYVDFQYRIDIFITSNINERLPNKYYITPTLDFFEYCNTSVNKFTIIQYLYRFREKKKHEHGPVVMKNVIIKEIISKILNLPYSIITDIDFDQMNPNISIFLDIYCGTEYKFKLQTYVHESKNLYNIIKEFVTSIQNQENARFGTYYDRSSLEMEYKSEEHILSINGFIMKLEFENIKSICKSLEKLGYKFENRLSQMYDGNDDEDENPKNEDTSSDDDYEFDSSEDEK